MLALPATGTAPFLLFGCAVPRELQGRHGPAFLIYFSPLCGILSGSGELLSMRRLPVRTATAAERFVLQIL